MPWTDSIEIDGVECLLLLPQINWRQRPRVTHFFETDILEGNTGIGSRASEHFEPRLSVDYLYTLKLAAAEEVIAALLALDPDACVALPLWPDKLPAAHYMARRKWAAQHWLNVNTATGAYALDEDGGHAESVGLLVGALVDRPRVVGKTDREMDFTIRLEEDSPWESRVDIHELAHATWDFPANWRERPQESSRWRMQRRRLGQGRRFARIGTEGATKRTQAGLHTFKSEEDIRRALTFWKGKRGPHAPFVMQRFNRPGWNGTPGAEPTMQARFADEALSLEFAGIDVAHATIAFEQDLLLTEGEPTQHRPSRAYLYKVWWKGAPTVKAWTDWGQAYTHAGVTYQPGVVEHRASTEVLGRVGQNEWELMVYDHDANPLRAFGLLQHERELLVEIRECDPAVADTAALLLTGRIMAAPNVGRIYTARAAMFGGVLQHMIPQTFGRPSCNNRFGDALCGVDIEALKVEGTIDAIDGTVIDIDCASAAAADTYALGFVQFGAGDDVELRFIIRSEPIAGGQRLTINRPLTLSAVAAAAVIYPGCDQQYEGGCATHNNQGRFFGANCQPAYIETVDSGFKAKVGK